MKTNISTLLLIAASIVLGTIVGVGIYEALFTMPAWFAAPPESFSLIVAHQNKTAKSFWIPLQIILMIQLSIGLVLNWKSRKRRKLLLGVIGCYLTVVVLSISYFVPEIMKFSTLSTGNTLPSPQLLERGKQWLTLSWSRHFIFLLAQVLLLTAISISPDDSSSVSSKK